MMKKNEERKPQSKSNPALPVDVSNNLNLLKIVWFIVTLVGMIAFIVLLIQNERTQIKRRFMDNKAQEGKNQQADLRPTPADDDPQIFNLRNFGWFTGILVGMIAFILIAGALLSGFFLTGGSIVTTPAPTLLPPEPRLQANPAQDFQALHATQEAELNIYGWIDRENGVVHIPIDRAMELIAHSNLPVVQGTPVSVTPQAP